MSTKRKGQRRERQAKEILEKLGYRVSIARNHRWGANDYFNLYDIIAVNPDEKIKFIQVKSNGTGGVLRRTGLQSAMFVPTQHVDVEYWICWDYEGWRIQRLDVPTDDPSDCEWNIILDERDKDGNMGEYVFNEYQ